MQSITEPRQVAIRSEFDIVNLRHTVRQMARTIGLDLTRQAKVTVAISALARAFLDAQGDVTFVARVLQNEQPALEIACRSADTHGASDAAQLEERLNLHEVRLLVDEFDIQLGSNGARLAIRMWLGH
jgi:anti-sigma regulatory factor (Ser/Thr protein kinase)